MSIVKASEKTPEEVLKENQSAAANAWSKFLEYIEKKIPDKKDRTADNIKNEWQNYFEKDENVQYAPAEKILDSMYEEWIKDIDKSKDIVKDGKDNKDRLISNAVKSVNDSLMSSSSDKNKDEDDKEENTDENDKDTSTAVTFGSKTSSVELTDYQHDLLHTPFATPYVTSYEKKVVNGQEVITSAVLKRYYSTIDAEIYFGNEYVEDVCNIDWNITQNTMPLFGYNSYKYDEVAQGNRIVSGSFDINFTSPNYLFKILKAASKVQEAVNYGNQGSFRTEMSGDVKAKLRDNTLTTYNHKGNRLAPIYNTSFDIDVVFGNYKDQNGGTPVHIILEDVWIQSSSVVLSASAAESPPAIRERYSFIARDIRTFVGTVTAKEQKGTARKK